MNSEQPGEVNDAEVERLWLIEAKRRLDEFEAGDTDSIPASEVAAKALRLLSALSPTNEKRRRLTSDS